MIKRFHKINTGNPSTWEVETEDEQAVASRASEFKASRDYVRSFLKRSKKERKKEKQCEQALWHQTQYQTDKVMCDWLSQKRRNKRIKRKYVHNYKQLLPSFGIGSKLRNSRNQTNIKKKEYKENHLPLTSFTLLKKKKPMGNMSNIKNMEKSNSNGWFCLSDTLFAERKCNGITLQGLKEKLTNPEFAIY